MDIDDIISLATAGELLGVSPETLRTQVRRGRFDARLVGKTWITTKDEVERYRREQLGGVGRAMTLVAKIPWPDNMYGASELRVTTSDRPAAAAWATVTELAQKAIAEGAFTLAEVWGKVVTDEGLRMAEVASTDDPPELTVRRKNWDDVKREKGVPVAG